MVRIVSTEVHFFFYYIRSLYRTRDVGQVNNRLLFYNPFFVALLNSLVVHFEYFVSLFYYRLVPYNSVWGKNIV